MRKSIIGAFILGAALAGGYATAQIVSGLPFQLQNNTLADATQVMANFNQIVNNTNSNAAKNGANNDITSLNALSTPISPSQGGTSTWLGAATSTGSANAQVVAATIPAVYQLGTGQRVVFKAGFSNTGAAVLNVASTGNGAILRPTQLGAVALVGGEIHAGQMTEVVWDGVSYQLVGTPDHVGAVMDTIEATAPAGWALADGTCISSTTYNTLFIIAGSTWGSCGAGLFAVPDLRGRTAIAPDGGANRVTNAGSGCTATLGTGCGAENETIAQANLPALTWPKTLAAGNGTLAGTIGTLAGTIGTLAINNTMGVSDTRTWQTSNPIFPFGGAQGFTVGATIASTSAQQAVVVASGTIALTGGTSLTGAGSLSGAPGLSGSVALTGDTTSGGSGTALTTLQPTLVVNKIIKL